jgi:hypothetical protein
MACTTTTAMKELKACITKWRDALLTENCRLSLTAILTRDLQVTKLLMINHIGICRLKISKTWAAAQCDKIYSMPLRHFKETLSQRMLNCVHAELHVLVIYEVRFRYMLNNTFRKRRGAHLPSDPCKLWFRLKIDSEILREIQSIQLWLWI